MKEYRLYQENNIWYCTSPNYPDKRAYANNVHRALLIFSFYIEGYDSINKPIIKKGEEGYR